MTPKENNQDKFNKLREEYPIFYFSNYMCEYNEEAKGYVLGFEFKCGEHVFHPTYVFYLSKMDLGRTIDTKTFTNLIIHIGMVELISYWKAFASPVVIIDVAYFSEKQIEFWKKLYFNGLGEYFYLNSIETNIDEFMTIVVGENKYKRGVYAPNINEKRVIVPVGGGKDSVVSLELLKRNGFDVMPIVINPTKAQNHTVSRSQLTDNYIYVQRNLDKRLIKLNKEGFLNGHTPFSALLAFVTLLDSYLFNIPHIALSNENSANESTVIGQEINHQYSKSIEFERDFREYVEEFVLKDSNYFSFLRPLSELQIAQLFSIFSAHHSVFRSCNAGSKKDIWCCNCPKCLFAYIILSPFIVQERLAEHIGENLLDKSSLKKYFNELTGIAEVKPFECVGTIEEVNLALALLVERYPESKELSLVKYWLSLPMAQTYLNMNKEKFLYEISNEHFLEERFSNIFSNPYAMYKKAEMVRMLTVRKLIIFGMGREGMSTHNLLRSIFPNKKFAIQDSNAKLIENEYLKEQQEKGYIEMHLGEEAKEELTTKTVYDLVIKSPGVALHTMTNPYKDSEITSQTNIFLSLYANQCVGITGTKGKSTTSTLIYNMIKANHKDTLFAGNIGKPMFDLIDRITPNTIIVLELSAHQLQYINQSPKVSVLLNLYEEHLDHFITYEEYQKAKLNILKYQTSKENAFIYNEESKLISSWIKKIKPKSTLLPINAKNYSFEEPKYLMGEHNKFNIMVAYEVAKFLGMESEEGLKEVLEFKGLEHRLEFVCYKDGVEYYNDSISTIAQTTIAALNSLEGVQTLILGGKDRGVDYSELSNILIDYKDLKNIAFVGEAGRRIKNLIKENPEKKSQFLVSDNYKEIVNWCKKNTKKGKKVLLSPAASSYDMFTNFEERGRLFKELVNED